MNISDSPITSSGTLTFTMISQRQLEIYNNLLKYVKEGEVFYIADQTFKGRKYRIFSYRLGAYTPFMQPDALEGRGIMFELDDNDQPVRLACRTMLKFFNLNENPSTMNLDLSVENIELITDKVDGSLISTWLDHEGELQLKSKTSLGSDQVRMAWEVLNKNEHLKQNLLETTQIGWTVNLEYVGPDNQIVIGYAEPALRILNFRNNETGEYDFGVDVQEYPYFGYMAHRFESNYDLKSLENETGFEGVVVVLRSGQWFKLKTPWYAALHKTKDSINSPRKLFECIISEAADDLKAMFHADPISVAKIEEMEAKIVWKYLNVIRVVGEYYSANKDLDRKSYAVKGQERLPRELFSLAMTKYLGREVDYKEWAIKHYEYFGVKDEIVVEE